MAGKFSIINGKRVYEPTRKPHDGLGGGRKLNHDQAIDVFRAAHMPGARYRDIGKRFGISAHSVGCIARGQSYAFLFKRVEIGDGSYFVSELGEHATRFQHTTAARDKRFQLQSPQVWIGGKPRGVR